MPENHASFADVQETALNDIKVCVDGFYDARNRRKAYNQLLSSIGNAIDMNVPFKSVLSTMMDAIQPAERHQILNFLYKTYGKDYIDEALN